jgi:hypothetical protein
VKKHGDAASRWRIAACSGIEGASLLFVGGPISSASSRK